MKIPIGNHRQPTKFETLKRPKRQEENLTYFLAVTNRDRDEKRKRKRVSKLYLRHELSDERKAHEREINVKMAI